MGLRELIEKPPYTTFIYERLSGEVQQELDALCARADNDILNAMDNNLYATKPDGSSNIAMVREIEKVIQALENRPKFERLISEAKELCAEKGILTDSELEFSRILNQFSPGIRADIEKVLR